MNYGVKENTAAIKKATAQTAIIDFDAVISRLETLSSRAMHCGDSITGSRPADVSAINNDPSPPNLISAILLRRERLVRVADMLEEEIHRIESGLGCVDRP